MTSSPQPSTVAAVHTAPQPPGAIVLVYNANAGIIAGIGDSLHKLLSPATYPCRLCAITYGLLAMRAQWRRWLDAQAWPVEVFHRPDFRAAHPAQHAKALPAIFRRDGDRLTLLVGADAMDDIDDVSGLIAAVEAALAPAP